MVQTATLPYNPMSNGHYSSLIMGYPQAPSTAFYQDNRIYSRRDSSSAYSRSTSQPHAAWNQQQQQHHHHHHHHQQQQQQQPQQAQQSQHSTSTSPSSSAPSLPPLAEALHKIFPGQSSSQQPTQTQQPRITTQQSDASSVAIQAQQAYQAQQVASAYQHYGDVNSSYVLADAASYTSPSTTQVAQQIVSQASSSNSMASSTGLPPIVSTNAGPDISNGMMTNGSPPVAGGRHSRHSSTQMLALNTSMLPVTQDPSSGSPLTVNPIQNAPSLEYAPYPASLHHQQMLANPATAVYGPPSSTLGHRRNHSTSSSVSTSSTHRDDESTTSTGEHQKVFSFVALPGVNTKKRPRRKYEEIERHYTCNFAGCTKSYGTLNHLNAHVQMQKHGPKRHPSEFKELRKQWRRQKREEAIKKAAEDANHPAQQH